jgi:hypothetical protein
LIIASIWVVLSYFIPFTDDEGVWFARSGAIMVLLAVIVEFRFNNIVVKKISSTIKKAVLSKSALDTGIQKEQKNIAITAHIFVVLGTIIWGYGDLIK